MNVFIVTVDKPENNVVYVAGSQEKAISIIEAYKQDGISAIASEWIVGAVMSMNSSCVSGAIRVIGAA